jgi:hypothetical protein
MDARVKDAVEILDCGPKSGAVEYANMLAVSSSTWSVHSELKDQAILARSPPASLGRK